jgi:hypothetical protein
MPLLGGNTAAAGTGWIVLARGPVGGWGGVSGRLFPLVAPLVVYVAEILGVDGPNCVCVWEEGNPCTCAAAGRDEAVLDGADFDAWDEGRASRDSEISTPLSRGSRKVCGESAIYSASHSMDDPLLPYP